MTVPWDRCVQCADEFARRPLLRAEAAYVAMTSGKGAARDVVREALAEIHADHDRPRP